MTEDIDVNKSNENVNVKSNELFDFGVKRLRGRSDSLALTLPRSFVNNHKLGPVGKCFVHMYMDQKKRLIIEVSDMTDFAEKPKRVRKPKIEPVQPEEYAPATQPIVATEEAPYAGDQEYY